MSKIAVVYFSNTGNTEAMANLVAQGAQEGGAQTEMFTPENFSEDMVANFDAIAFGCPASGSEQLDDTEFEPMFEAISPALKGKKIALFGSHDWGDGEWMRNWQDNCRELGANLVADGVIGQYEPNDEVSAALVDLGKSLA